MIKIFFSLIAFIIIYNNRVYAAIDQLPVDPIGTSDVIKMIVYLVVILLLIYSLFWFIKKRNKFSKSSLFNSFGGYPLGQNKSIQIIEIGNKVYILGISGEINLIKVLEDEEDIKIIKKLAYPDNKRSSNMFKILKNKQGNSKQFEDELAEKFDQLKEKRIYSINNIFEEREEITEKRD